MCEIAQGLCSGLSYKEYTRAFEKRLHMDYRAGRLFGGFGYIKHFLLDPRTCASKPEPRVACEHLPRPLIVLNLPAQMSEPWVKP